MRKERITLKVSTLVQNNGQLGWLPKNPRQWTQTDIDRTAASIREDEDFLEDRPLLVVPKDAKTWVVFAGNLRLTAAKKIGLKEVPCIAYARDTDEDEMTIKRRAMKDNGSFGSWDYDALANEWDDLPLQDWGVPAWETEDKPATPEVKEDDFNEDAEVETRCNPGDIWQLGEHRLMCGDSTDAGQVALLMNGAKADMCFTDPPYGVEYTGGIQFKADGSVEHNNREMIENDDKDIYADVFPILRDFVNGPCYVWFAGTKAASLYNAAEKYGEIHSLIIWVKNGGYGALNANYKQKHEPCLYWKPKNATLNFCGETTETTIWDIAKDGINEYHPTQKPVALSAKAIGNHTAKSVLDLFGGSGSTLIAAEQLGRRCYMMELDPHYCDVIISRWETFTGKTAQLITPGDKVS